MFIFQLKFVLIYSFSTVFSWFFKIVTLSTLANKRLLLVLFGIISEVKLSPCYNSYWPYIEIIFIVLLMENFVNGAI